MSMNLFRKKKAKEVVQLQLTAMVDLVTILIIYLLVSTVFGQSDMVLPPNLLLPSSKSSEQPDSASQIMIDRGIISFSESKKEISLNELLNGGPNAISFLSEIKGAYIRQKERMGKKPVLLSLIADKKEKYSTIFAVVAQVKRTGYDTVLFVATGGN